MQIKVINDADGCPAVQVVDADGNVSASTELAHDQQVTIEIEGTATLGDPTASETPGDGDPDPA